MGPINQDDANPLGNTTGFESDDLIDLIGLDASLSPESRFYFDNVETIIFQNMTFTLLNNFTTLEGQPDYLDSDGDDASEPMVLVREDISNTNTNGSGHLHY